MIKLLRICGYVALISFVSLVVVFVLADAFDWDTICGGSVEIDINSGDLRYRTYLGFVVINEQVHRTVFSGLAREFVDVDEPPQWRTDHSWSILKRISPLYRWHGAAHHTKYIALAVAMSGIPDAEAASLTRESLALLKEGKLGEIEMLSSKAFEAYYLND